MSLCWKVYTEDFNNKCIKEWNIFNHLGFKEDCINYSETDDKEEFAEDVKKSLMYYFWCKSEYEIVISCWIRCNNFNDMKVDIYGQVMMNYDRFVDYLWKELKGE